MQIGAMQADGHGDDDLAMDDGAGRTQIRPRFMMRAVMIFGSLALLSGAISLGGKWLGQTIALAGHSSDTSLHEIVIGNDVLNIPANMIRFEASRRDGIAERVDLYLRWPQMDGYSDAARDAFNHADGDKSILFLAFEPRAMSRDMSGRYEPIYRKLIDATGRPGPGGLSVHRFSENSGYVDEVLVVEDAAKNEPFVMRCLSGLAARESLAPCERDIHITEGLSLTYRMPAGLAGEWREIEAKVRQVASNLVKMDAAN